MRLHEYHCKQIFSKYGIPVPRGRVIASACEARLAAVELGGKVVVKAQVLVRGRGKAGGIRLAKSPVEAEEVASTILRMKIKGLTVHKALVDEMVSISKELYLGITNDRSVGQPVIMACSAGGVDIEEVARLSPEKIIRVYLDPWLGLRDYHLRSLASAIDLPERQWRVFGEIAHGLWQVYVNCDATLAEINPLVVTTTNTFVALDSKMIVDENAFFRHPDIADMRDMEVEDSGEAEARKYDLSYIRLDGDIGCLVNGAGLAMATMDMIQQLGGRPANFLDIGSDASVEKASVAMRILLSNPNVRVIVINVFGGFTQCDDVARGILKAVDEVKPKIRVVVRLGGTKAEEGRDILMHSNLVTAASLVEAAQKAIEFMKVDKNEHPH